MNRHSIRFRIAVIVSLAIAISLGGFAVFLTTEIGSVNERDETAKLKSSNDMLMSMIAQTDSILREQAERVAAAYQEQSLPAPEISHAQDWALLVFRT